MKPRLRIYIILLYLIYEAETAPCDITGGRHELILDVTESIGQDFSQPILPEELPVEGEPGTVIALELSDGGAEWFSLKGKSLSLTKPLDRDENNLSTLRFEISCTVRSSTQIRSIPVVVRIRDYNDNKPEFKGAPYSVAIKEDAPVNSPIFNGIQAIDRDSGRNGQVEYEIVTISPDNGEVSPVFSIRFPHQGAVFLMAPLDYEATPLYQVTVLATDFSESESTRLNSTTTLTIRILDVDDQDPDFDTAEAKPGCSISDKSSLNCISEYHSSVIEGEIAGVLDVYPGRIHAKDMDTLGASISYSFQSGTPSTFEEYFKIDSRTAVVKQIKKIDRTQIKKFNIVMQATENTARRGSTLSRLVINVQKVDTSPPKLVIPAYTGKVKEASSPGTPVLRDDGSNTPFVLSVFDPDIEIGEDPPHYIYELTTSSFEVNEQGVLVVADPNLDRDAPSLSEHTFQAIAREDREGGSASAPVTLTVHLLDINDNPPRLPIIPTVTVPAKFGQRDVVEVRATDADEGENAVVRYEILSGAREKFVMDPNTGMIQSVGNLEAGEDYFLNIQATDKGNLSSEGFVEIVVSRGPNTNGPIFSRSRYSTIVSEDIAHGEEILTVQAKDPEDAVSYYSIIGGDGGNAFEIDTLTGLIRVVAPLDREKQSEHTLIIQAEDSEGKSNTASVYIQVTDVNDERPMFIGEPYSFRVDEGFQNASVGIVKAEDKDLGVFGDASYNLEGDIPEFKINSKTGEIFTKKSLDYEKDQVHYLSVVAHDMADDPRSATTTVTILVNDISDEKPFFPQKTYKAQVLEHTAIGTVITTVVAVDKDTVPSITYKMVEGDSRLFKVAPDSGRVTVAGNLDYEVEFRHSVVVGTEENDGGDEGATTTLIIELEDINDEVPIIEPIHTVTLAKEAPYGTLITNISAVDKDGSAPNNQIKFELSDNATINHYFQIDEVKGEIRLKNLMTNTNFTELSIKFSATDGGEPPLSASGEFRVLLLEGTIDTFGESSYGELTSSGVSNGQKAISASSPRFSKNEIELEVNENIPMESVVVKIPLLNTTVSSVTCSIVNGNEEEIFKTKITSDGNCKILNSQNLDFESTPQFNLSLALHPEGFVVTIGQEKPVLSEAFVQINVKDINDNAPLFNLEGLQLIDDFPKTTVLSFSLQASPVDTMVMQLQASDSDSGERGMIEYKLLPESNRGNYFSVDPISGKILIKRILYNVPLELLPFNLSLIAMDKPGINGTQHTTPIDVIIPIIEKTHQSILLLDIPKQEVEQELRNLEDYISKASGKTAQIEEVKQNRRISKKETQIWFHLLDPNTLRPVDPQIYYEDEKNKEFLKHVSTSLMNARALQLFSPSQLIQASETTAKDASNIQESRSENGIIRLNSVLNLTTLEYVLIGLAGFIILFVLCAIIVICALWSRFSKKWNSADKRVMLIPPVMERPSSVLESVSKEYEVQVLHMSVPLDDDSVHESPVENESPRQPYLDNVSYISKSRNGLEGSSSGGSSGLATPSGLVMDQSGGGTFTNWTPNSTFGGDNFSSTHLDDPNGLSTSATNENVMFGRKGFGEPSPVETTTEL